MSRTYAHRPVQVQARDPRNWRHIQVIEGPFDPRVDEFDWRKTWWLGPPLCGCRMCTGHWERKQERKANRAAGRRVCRRARVEVEKEDLDLYTAPVVEWPNLTFRTR